MILLFIHTNNTTVHAQDLNNRDPWFHRSELIKIPSNFPNKHRSLVQSAMQSYSWKGFISMVTAQDFFHKNNSPKCIYDIFILYLTLRVKVLMSFWECFVFTNKTKETITYLQAVNSAVATNIGWLISSTSLTKASLYLVKKTLKAKLNVWAKQAWTEPHS